MNILTVILLIILGAVTLALLLVVWKLLSSRGKDAVSKETLSAISDLGALKTLVSSVDTNQKMHNQIMQEMKGLVSSDSKAQHRLQDSIEHTLSNIENIKQANEDFKQREQENRESLRRMEAVIAGTKLKGIAGENILKEALSSFPPRMVRSNVKIKGKEVEFALVLSDNKLMPLDSKWPSTSNLEQFSKTEDSIAREKIAKQVQKDILKRVDEVSQYIEPETTTPWALAAVPDSAYQICKSAHFDAYKKNVILISYSMIAPYLLMFFSLHLQYASTVDLDNLTHYLLDIKRHVERMTDVLENKVYKASAMISNASEEYRQIIGAIKGSISAIETQNVSEESKKKIGHAADGRDTPSNISSSAASTSARNDVEKAS